MRKSRRNFFKSSTFSPLIKLPIYSPKRLIGLSVQVLTWQTSSQLMDFCLKGAIGRFYVVNIHLWRILTFYNLRRTIFTFTTLYNIYIYVYSFVTSLWINEKYSSFAVSQLVLNRENYKIRKSLNSVSKKVLNINLIFQVIDTWNNPYSQLLFIKFVKFFIFLVFVRILDCPLFTKRQTFFFFLSILSSYNRNMHTLPFFILQRNFFPVKNYWWQRLFLKFQNLEK